MFVWIFPLPWISLLASSLVHVLLGMIWFHPNIFGGILIDNGLKTKDSQSSQPCQPTLYQWFGALAVGFLLSLGIHSIIELTQLIISIQPLEMLALVWIGFVATQSLSSFIWEGKSIASHIALSLFWLIDALVIMLVLRII